VSDGGFRAGEQTGCNPQPRLAPWSIHGAGRRQDDTDMDESYQSRNGRSRSGWWRGLLTGGVLGIVAIAGVGTMLFGCSSKEVKSYYVDDYLAALDHYHGVSDAEVIERGVRRFTETLGDLTVADLRQRVEATYADDLYFNDTFKTLRRLDELAPYLAETGEKVSQSRVDVLSHVADGEDVYVRWVMDFTFSAAGREIDSRSIGLSHLRFDDSGRIVLHQDFWDSADGFYSNLPFVGGLLHRVRKQL
jgi:hypothetical protein